MAIVGAFALPAMIYGMIDALTSQSSGKVEVDATESTCERDCRVAVSTSAKNTISGNVFEFAVPEVGCRVSVTLRTRTRT
jgi:hypothetical protein